MYHEMECELMFARILGNPYTSDYGEIQWSFDAKVDKTIRKQLADLGVSADKIKHNDKHNYDYIQFKRPAVRKDGSSAQPIAVVDADVQPWNPEMLIGNGSLAKVRFAINERKNPRTGQTSLVPSVVAIQVVEHVPYVGTGKGGFKPVARKVEAETWDNA